jgi:hypothetical protein
MSSAIARWIGSLCSRLANFAYRVAGDEAERGDAADRERLDVIRAEEQNDVRLSSEPLPTSFIARPACSSCFGSSSGGS